MKLTKPQILALCYIIENPRCTSDDLSAHGIIGRSLPLRILWELGLVTFDVPGHKGQRVALLRTNIVVTDLGLEVANVGVKSPITSR